jgi:alkyl sulfatase BDS1-like metallo-beta-lactamase superfamily hydrolase
VIDGVEIAFQLAPDTEAPAEMHFWFPGERALNLAENATHTLHNLCPLRGAQVRDALAWSKYLDVALERWGARCDVVLAQHHWPTFGGERVRRFLAEQRDLYRVLHDQTVRMMSQGLKPAEIAEALRLPEGLAARWHARGYYGTVSHNVKAIYQRYLSWYDAHPANLNPLPPVPAARRYVEYMGGLEAVIAKARDDFERGEYRWVAEVMKHAVYAHPDHAGARALAADALEQMGFAAESATWRNAYLLGAREYREGPPKATAIGAGGLLAALPAGLLFDAIAVRLNGPRAGDAAFTLAWRFTDGGGTWRLRLSSGALHALEVDEPPPEAAATLESSRPTLDAILAQQLPAKQAVAEGRLVVTGDFARVVQLFGLLDRFDPCFPVVDAAAGADGGAGAVDARAQR